jgi:hypothetical protein
MGKKMAAITLLAKFLRCSIVFCYFSAFMMILRGFFKNELYRAEQIIYDNTVDSILKPVLQINEKNMGFVYITGDEARRDPKNDNLIQIDNVIITSSNFVNTANHGTLDFEKNEIILSGKPKLSIK